MSIKTMFVPYSDTHIRTGRCTYQLECVGGNDHVFLEHKLRISPYINVWRQEDGVITSSDFSK